jgi:hypothetical protein
MSTPDSTAETSGHGNAQRTKQDTLTQSVGTPLAATTPKPSWWKRLLGRS